MGCLTLVGSRSIDEMGASFEKGLSSAMITVCSLLGSTLWIFPFAARKKRA